VRSSGMYMRESNWYGAMEHIFAVMTSLPAAGMIIATQRLFDAATQAAYGEF